VSGLRRVEEVMGTAISLHIADPLPVPELERLADRVFDWFHEVDRRFSTYKADSEVNRLQRGELDAAAGSPDLRDVLDAAGAGNHCINAGGDLRVRGRPAPGEEWRTGIRHPWEAQEVCWVLAGTDLAIATSGTYERGFHVIDPYRGEAAKELRSVTVVGPDLGRADAYATAALAMGRAGLDWLARLEGYESGVVTEDGRAFRSAGLPTV